MVISIWTLNCQGLNSVLKKNALKSLVDKFHPTLVCLQETNMDLVRHGGVGIHGYSPFYNSCTTVIGSGLIFLLHHKCSFISHSILIPGKLSKFIFNFQNIDFTIFNSHFPFKKVDSMNFLSILQKNIPKNPSSTLLLGDWNFVLSEALDRRGGPEQRKTLALIFAQFLNSHNLHDAYRHLSPVGTDVTFVSHMGSGASARLDRMYVDHSILSKLTSYEIFPFLGDHMAFSISFASTSATSNCRWSLPHSLLQVDAFLFTISGLLNNFLESEFSLVGYEKLKFKIIQVAMELDSYHNSQLKALVRRTYRGLTTFDPDSHAEIMKDFLESLNGKTGNAVCCDFPLRKIAQHNDSLSVGEALDHLSHEEKMDHIHSFFSAKFSKKHTDLTGLDTYTSGMPTIPDISSEFLGRDLECEEFLHAINSSPNNKAPGFDGLTYELYKTFPEHFSRILLHVANYSLREGAFPRGMRSAFLTLLYKGGDAKELKNFRPIQMTNCDYKIISTVLKNRIAPSLFHVIGPWQTFGVPGRSIFDNLSFVRDAFESGELNGGIFSLDQEAAFDRVDFNFLLRMLKIYNFPPKIVDFVKLLLTDFSLVVAVGSDYTASIPIEIGVKQGDPIGPILYSLAIEPLLFRLNERLRGLGPSAWPSHPESFISAYADDTNIFLGSESQIQAVEEEYGAFSLLSASKLNERKSELLLLGDWLSKPISTHFPLKRDGLKILGMYFGTPDYFAQNWSSLESKMEAKLQFYSEKCPAVSHYSRAKILNTFILPLLWYQGKVLNPPEDFLSDLCKKSLNYIWYKSKRWVSKPYVFLPVENGGLGVRNPKVQLASFRLTFLRKVLCSSQVYFLKPAEEHLKNMVLGKCDNFPQHYKKFHDLTQVLDLRVTSASESVISALKVTSFLAFGGLDHDYLIKGGVTLASDLLGDIFSDHLVSLPAAVHRRITKERSDHLRELESITQSENFTFSLPSFFKRPEREEISRDRDYVNCLTVDSDLIWSEIDFTLCQQPCWKILKKVEISNPQKDIVFKFWHDVGLTPSLANHLKIYNSTNCPYCGASKVRVRHYLLCPHVAPLKSLLSLFLQKVNIPPNACVPAFFSGSVHEGANILIFYAHNVIYKAFVHKLNNHQGDFDQLKTFRQLLFGRLLSEFHGSKNNKIKLEKFCEKWKKFEFFEIKNNSILIHFNF
jgi:exonuclease III